MFAKTVPRDRPLVTMAMVVVGAAVLVAARLCEPSSELHIAEDWYRRTALSDLLGVPDERVNDDRLYRALDQLLPHKAALEGHLKQRLGELFALDYELLLYDVTSTYFEGEAAAKLGRPGGDVVGQAGDAFEALLEGRQDLTGTFDQSMAGKIIVFQCRIDADALPKSSRAHVAKAR